MFGGQNEDGVKKTEGPERRSYNGYGGDRTKEANERMMQRDWNDGWINQAGMKAWKGDRVFDLPLTESVRPHRR
jgi:hypothetical protein